MAKRYPQVNILGIDLSSALLPEDVPPNVTFEIADATDPWPARTYDFIHMRSLAGAGVRDWDSLLAEAYEHLKPGVNWRLQRFGRTFSTSILNKQICPARIESPRSARRV
ncbi:hypothetical protein NXS19_000210 [Fusarium pseudograminearum]|nr:hypothetical protein NXS19_000210 [Fusarium pseudograminearum]